METRADAKVSRSRFGMALASLGDINLDKYGGKQTTTALILVMTRKLNETVQI